MRAAALALLLTLSACASTPPVRGFEGDWQFSFETSSFKPTGREEAWWFVTGNNFAWDQATAPLRANNCGPWGVVHVRVEGRLIAPGQYGHLGAYARELHVERVRDARLVNCMS